MVRAFMKNRGFLLYLPLLCLWVSCASRPPPAKEPLEKIPSLDRVLQQIKENGPEIKKYVLLDETGAFVVKADIAYRSAAGETEIFEAVYDLNAPGFEIPFLLRSPSGIEVRDALHWTLQDDQAGLLLGFDDDYHDVWEQNFELFDRWGAKVTFFVQGAFCSFCIAALERGHDVGYHTAHHLNLPKVSRDVFFEETVSEIPGFRNNGVPLTSFAYPYGLSEPWMHEELLKSFKLLRGYGVTFRIYDTEALRKGYIISKALDTILFKEDDAFESLTSLMLRTVKFIGGDTVLPLTTHTISDTADWGIKPGRLEYLLKTARDLGLKFYRYCDFTG
jgi:peptidoglycan/xylan/chitin deacetylase (PgdA/CDA1 family)